jgi:hypothetical protein
MWRVWRGEKLHIAFSWENLTERENFENLDVDGRLLLIWILNRMGGHGVDSSGSG